MFLNSIIVDRSFKKHLEINITGYKTNFSHILFINKLKKLKNEKNIDTKNIILNFNIETVNLVDSFIQDMQNFPIAILNFNLEMIKKTNPLLLQYLTKN